MKLADIKNNMEGLKHASLQKLSQIIFLVGKKALEGIHSQLIEKPLDELERLKKEARYVLGVELTDENRTKVLQQLSKLSNKSISTLDDYSLTSALKNVESALEGIVFSYGGKLFKLTGAFAPLNRLFGIFKYGD